MRKKYLSALLFGALLFASAGTFTSCKDYDDDINNLQGQIDANADAIKALQDLVGDGKFVSAVSNNGNTITFTFTDGTTQAITLEDQVGSVVTVNADGVLCIDGDPTEIKVAADPTPGEEHKDQIIIENNMWSVLQEDGTYKSTNIPVSGVTVSGSEADGYTFTIYAADGTSQSVELPSAASSITELTLGDETKQNGVLPTKVVPAEKPAFTGIVNPVSWTYDVNDVLISRQPFTFNSNNISEVPNAAAWMGNKKLPNDGDVIYASPTSIDLRVDPVDVPANNIQFYLTDSKNNNLSPFVFTASASQDSNYGPMGETEMNGRAAVTGNGLWTLSMANQTVASSANDATWKNITDADNKTVYAVNANNAFRSKYELNVRAIDPEKLKELTIKGEIADEEGEGIFKFDVNAAASATTDNVPLKSNYPGTGDSKDQNTNFKTNKAYRVNGVEESALYDMYLTADKSDCDVYGLTFDQDAHTFTIGKNPDVSSIPAEFDLIVYTVSNAGVVNKATVTIVLNSEISTPAEYGLHEHDVNKDNNVNYFSIDLATMKTALGDNLNQWMQNVDLSKTVITFGEKADGSDGKALKGIEGDGSTSDILGIEASVVEKLTNKDDVNNHKATTDRNKANYIQIDVENAKVNGLNLDKTYYIKATFYATDANEGGVLNSIIVPVEFHAPALADLFTKKDAYVDKTNDVINAYFYQTTKATSATTAPTAVTLARFFNDFVADAQVSFASDKVGETGKTGEELFVLTYKNASDTEISGTTSADVRFGKDNSVKGSTENIYTTLDFDVANNAAGIYKGQGVNGYNEVVTINVQKGYYNTELFTDGGWNYAQDSDKKYSFKIRLMSPIYEGSVVPVSGNTINISANDWANGARITDAMIKGADYNKNTYNVVPDKVKKVGESYTNAWDNPQIDNVAPGLDEQHLISSANVSPATLDKDGNTVNGAFVVQGENITNTTEVQMPVTVTDVWGYKLEEHVSVTIQMNE